MIHTRPDPVAGCQCGHCVNQRRKRKYRKAQKDLGRPRNVLPGEFEGAVAKLRAYESRGMTRTDMHKATGLNQACFTDWMNGVNKTMNRSSYDIVMAMEFSRETPLGARVSPVGAQRRLQILRLAGWPTRTFLAPILETTQGEVAKLAAGKHKFIFHETHLAVVAVYDKYRSVDPLEYGIKPFDVHRAKIWAKRMGCVPAHCWDDDTIDDPEAIPEWTGECGTPAGYRLHQRYEMLPACKPCVKAQTAYQYEFRLRRWDDACIELLGEGLTRQEVADRLGINVQTVYRAQKRHKEKEEQ